MSAQHTPGPWHASNLRTTGPSPGSCIGAETGENIGLIYRDEWDIPSDVARANARLIAAAPEMLEALKQCEALLAGMYRQAPTLDAARAAIAKATGGKP